LELHPAIKGLILLVEQKKPPSIQQARVKMRPLGKVIIVIHLKEELALLLKSIKRRNNENYLKELRLSPLKDLRVISI